MKATNQSAQADITPERGLQLLKEGNRRFVQSKQEKQDFHRQIEVTREGQFPFATILSCIDSRVPLEMIFDQGLGDLFSIRIAGNVVDDDVLGSMEFGAKLAGAKLIVVMGHTGCGAVKGACNDAKLGKLTGLLEKIKPAVKQVEPGGAPQEFENRVSEKNVELSLSEIRGQSEILRTMEENGEIRIIGAMYDIATGEVRFY